MLNGLQENLRDIVIIAKKELRHCFRDSHVLIYTVFIPLVLYPLALVGLSEYMLWRQGLSETSPLRIAFYKNGIEKIPELVEVAKKTKKVVVVESSNPDADLKAKKLECIVDGSPVPKDIRILVNPGSDRFMETRIQLLTLSFEASTLATQEAIKKSGQPKQIATVFEQVTKNVGTVGGKKGKQDDMEMTMFSTTIVLVGFYAYTLMIIAIGAIYPALAAFTEEAEKKTKFTTYLLPVERSSIVTGKFIAVSIMSFLSGMINLFSMGTVAFYFFTRMPFLEKMFGFAANQFSVANVLLLLFILVISILLIAATFTLIAASAKSFKEAQNISSIVLMFVTIMPLISILPGWSLSITTALIPVLNMVLTSKAIITDTLNPLIFSLTLLVNFFLTAILLHFSQIIFWGREPGSQRVSRKAPPAVPGSEATPR